MRLVTSGGAGGAALDAPAADGTTPALLPLLLGGSDDVAGWHCANQLLIASGSLEGGDGKARGGIAACAADEPGGVATCAGGWPTQRQGSGGRERNRTMAASKRVA